jgi:molecular chaperone Hsp33
MNEVQGFVLEGRGIRGAVVRLEETWLQIVAQHYYPDRIKELLGEAVAATVLLGNGLKDRPRVSLQLNGDGPLKLLLTQCSEDLKVRGMVQWRDTDRHQSLLGSGRLAVNLDTGRRSGFFQGIVPLVSAELTGCLESYFARSEQLPTRLFLFGGERQVAGLMLQMLPGRDTEAHDFAEAAALAASVTCNELASSLCQELLPRVFGDFTIRLFSPRPVLHDCRCTPEHLASIARMLGAEELASLLVEQGAVELTCEFCNRQFRYSPRDIEAILEGAAPGPALH